MKGPKEVSPEDEFDHYAEQLEIEGKSQRTIRQLRTVENKFKSFLEREGLELDEVGVREAKKWMNEERETVDDSAVIGYARRLNSMVSYYVNRGYFDANPVEIAINELSWDVDKRKNRKELSLDELRAGIQSEKRPVNFTMLMLLAKTGIRAGEAANLDWYDIHLDHPLSERLMPNPRTEIQDDTDTLFIDSNISEGDEVRGEVRGQGNKRKLDTKIPIDKELKDTLIWWMGLQAQSRSPANPVLTQDGGGGRAKVGDRLSNVAVSQRVKEWARKRDWNIMGGGIEQNITAHWFRHFFTTHMSRRISPEEVEGNNPRDVVKYYRGDVGADIIDTYTHHWGNYLEEAYLDNIYKLLGESNR